jgi:DnaJ-domain-containing protein 1
MKAALNAANIDVEDVTIDGFGQTREQARITNAILDLLSEAVWADGSASKEELFVATTFGVRLVGDSVTIEEIEGRLRIHTRAKIPPSMLNNPDRIVLLRAALTIIAADGVVENRELFFVQGLAERLNVPGELLDRLLESAGFGRNRTRSNTSRSDSLHRAAEILGISSSSSPKEAKNAQRRLALKHHPDRAGPDPTAVKYANAKMAELNWAYEQFASEGSL